jgi:phthalate 4,5-cis-dihydrodiol dehydrogenase
MLMLPTLARDPRIRMVAAADPRPGARARFEAHFDARSYETMEALCAHPGPDAVYIATPHQFHVAQMRAAAAAAGKQALVEKPVALSVEDCLTVVSAARQAGIHLIVGHSHSFDAPNLHVRADPLRPIRRSAHGDGAELHGLSLPPSPAEGTGYRPGRRGDLLPGAASGGGGASAGRAPCPLHPCRCFRLGPGAGTEGAYNALLDFDESLSATLIYNGHGHFDTEELQDWTSEMGTPRDPAAYGTARAALRRLTCRSRKRR